MAMADVLVSSGLRVGEIGTSRREFIKRVGLVAASGALLVAGAGVGGAAPVLPVPGAALRRSLFATRLGDSFRVQVGSSGSISLRLVEVRDLVPAVSPGAARDADREESFLIQFSGPRDRPLEQQLYRVEHAWIGAFALFIVPMAPDPEARYYEAIFNRRQA
jgi:hypothetical protein